MKYQDAIRKYIAINDELAEALEANSSSEEWKKNTNILETGKYCKNLYFIEKGLVRGFHLRDGKDITSWFYSEGDVCTSWHSFLLQVPSQDSLEALEDTVVRVFTYDQLQGLYAQFSEMERMGRLVQEEQLAFLDYYFKSYDYLSAQEKYAALQEYFPNLINRVKLGHLASFIGITQETLSRVRANWLKKEG